MGLMDKMNYRMQNPDITLSVDEEIVTAFLSREREKNVTVQFSLWASMSKENVKNKLITTINEKTKEQSLTK